MKFCKLIPDAPAPLRADLSALGTLPARAIRIVTLSRPPVWDVTVFTKNRERLLAGDVAVSFLLEVMGDPAVRRLLSIEHFSVVGTLIDA